MRDKIHDRHHEADAICLAPSDNVATVLRPIAAGEIVRVRAPEGSRDVRAREPIPFCHKVSLAALPRGQRVVKYGQPIGSAVQAIEPGSHVHVHNMSSDRARR